MPRKLAGKPLTVIVPDPLLVEELVDVELVDVLLVEDEEELEELEELEEELLELEEELPPATGTSALTSADFPLSLFELSNAETAK